MAKIFFFKKKFQVIVCLLLVLLLLSSCTNIGSRSDTDGTHKDDIIGKPSYFSQYESSKCGEVIWGISTLVSSPYILICYPGCEIISYLKGYQTFFMTPCLSYMHNPHTHYVSNKIVTLHYTLLSFPFVLIKYMCDW